MRDAPEATRQSNSTRNETARIETARSSDQATWQMRIGKRLGGAIFYGLLLVIALSAVPYGTVHPWAHAIVACCIFIIACAWSVESLFTQRWLISPHQRVLLPAFLLVVWTFLQSLPLTGSDLQSAISRDPYETATLALRFLAFLLTLALLLRFTSSPARFRSLVYLVVGLCLLSAIYGIARQTLQRDEAGFILPFMRPDTGYGQFVNRNHFAFLMEMGLGLTLGFALSALARRDRKIVLLVATWLFVWTALVLANSRGGILAMFCQTIVAALLFNALRPRTARASSARFNSSSDTQFDARELSPARLRRGFGLLLIRAALVVCLLAGLFVGVVWVGGERFVERVERSKEIVGQATRETTTPSTQAERQYEEEAGDGTGRGEIWRDSLNLIKTNPLVGVGFGGYWIAFTEFHRGTGKLTVEQAHNDYLELLASGGAVGFALFAWFVVAIIVRGVRELRHTTDAFGRASRVGAFVGLSGIAVHSFVEFGLHMTVNALAAIVLIAIICTRAKDVRDQADSRAVDQDAVQIADAKQRASEARETRANETKAFKVMRVVSPLLAVFAVALFAWLAWSSARAGLGRFYAVYAPRVSRLLAGESEQKRLEFADRAVSLAPSDPETHYARAVVLADLRRFDEAVRENELALSLRPRDYFLWTTLGRFCEKDGRNSEAENAFRRAVELAPNYAEQRWQLGNFLLRTGRTDEAFAELSRAIEADDTRFDYAINLAWKFYDADAARVENGLRINGASLRFRLARFYLRKKSYEEATRVYHSIENNLSEKEQREMLVDLLTAKRFTEAYAVWSGLQETSADDENNSVNNNGDANSGTGAAAAVAAVLDGSFERAVKLDEQGFGWQQSREVKNVVVALDGEARHTGAYSLAIEFMGESTPSLPVLSQLVLIEPNARYTLSFAARAKKIVSGGLPVVRVRDASDATKLLAQTEAIPRDTNDEWRMFTVDFTTGAETRAVLIEIARSDCGGVCPAFGRAWFDDFIIRKR